MPKVPTVEEARKALLSLGKPGPLLNGQQSPRDGELPARLLVPTDVHARIVVELMEFVWASYESRNPRDPEYRARAFEANAFLRERPRNPADPESRPLRILSVPKKSQKSKHDIPRGYVVCAPAQCGRTKLADAIEAYMARGAKKEAGTTFEPCLITTGGCVSQFIRIRTLRVTWPLDGAPERSFTTCFVPSTRLWVPPPSLNGILAIAPANLTSRQPFVHTESSSTLACSWWKKSTPTKRRPSAL